MKNYQKDVLTVVGSFAIGLMIGLPMIGCGIKVREAAKVEEVQPTIQHTAESAATVIDSGPIVHQTPIPPVLTERETMEASLKGLLSDEADATAPEKPEYMGTIQLVGTYAGPFNDDSMNGIVLKAESKYYLVLDANAYGTSLAYVTPTGRTVTLNIGDGRECEVVRMVDDEQYRIDHKEYQASLVTWQQDLQTFSKESAERKKKITSLKLSLAKMK